MTIHRILITGSRTWPKPFWIEETICDYITDFWTDEDGFPNNFIIVHGGAKGADSHAAQACTRLSAMGWPVIEEVHKADWAQFGKAAGFIRNSYMVSLGADVCLAYIHNESNGATMCANLAAEKKIPIRHYRIDGR